MFESIRGAVLRVLRVPHDPTPPADGGAVRVFRASPRYYRYLLAVWGLGQLGALLGLIGTLVLLRVAPDSFDRAITALTWFEMLAWAGWLVQLPITYATLRLDWDLRWYMLTGRSLRIREGVWTVQEKTMTFANVQNMTVRQGPLQRLLGIADLEVRTAGGGSGGGDAKGKGLGGDLHVALLRGVDDAAAIRDLIRERVRQHRDAGLGDPDDPEHPVSGEAAALPSPATDPAAELLAAARELREAVRGRAASPMP